jgi:hypothetical protein
MNTFQSLHAMLPKQREIQSFFSEDFFPEHKTESFHLSELVEESTIHFDVPEPAAEMKLGDYGYNGHGNTGTFLECLVIFAVQRLIDEGLIKRVGPNIWAHVTSSLPVYKPVAYKKNVPKRLVDEARVSVRILKSITNKETGKPFDETEVFLEMCGRTWTDEIIERAIELEFATTKPTI